VDIRIGRSGIAAIAAVALAAGVIGYRIMPSGGDEVPAIVPRGGSIAELEQRAASSPNDPGAWQELGFAHFGEGNFSEAVLAYARATEISPKSAVLWSSLGEARVMASTGDPMPAAALDAFRKSIELDPSDPRARYFLAVQKDLEGDHAGAIGDWLALLKDTPPSAPWESDLQRTIEQVGKINKIDVDERIAAAMTGRAMPAAPGDAAVPGPTQEQLAAASSIPPSAQQDMAEGMVERLAQRLKDDPSNVDGWIMLMRSYRTLGREADARAALRSAMAANPARADELRAAAASLGVTA
jgi:cytochrome c-type biogenesis protein CcmH